MLSGSGWAELDGASVYSEPSPASAPRKVLRPGHKADIGHGKREGGNVSATGSYDIKSHAFQVDAKAAGIDISRIERLRAKGFAVTGKLGIFPRRLRHIDDPRLEAHANLAKLALSGEPLGALEFTARTANRSVTYDMTTRLETAELALHGQTALNGDNLTQARLEFSRFNIGGLLKLAHVPGLNGESALAGTVTFDGPLARPGTVARRSPPPGVGSHCCRRSFA